MFFLFESIFLESSAYKRIKSSIHVDVSDTKKHARKNSFNILNENLNPHDYIFINFQAYRYLF